MASTGLDSTWAPLVHTGKIWQLMNHLRSLVWVQLTHDNPLAWKLGFIGGREHEDIEGEHTLHSSLVSMDYQLPTNAEHGPLTS